MKKDCISKQNASVICRVFMKLDNQVSIAFCEGRDADAKTLSRLIGALEYRIFDTACIGELEVTA
jgi:hypothetical protein